MILLVIKLYIVKIILNFVLEKINANKDIQVCFAKLVIYKINIIKLVINNANNVRIPQC